MFYMGRPIVIGVPLARDWKIDARLKDTIYFWEMTNEKVEVHHPISHTPEAGRDSTVQYAKYRIPSPTHILFIDADVLPHKQALRKLIELDVDIVVGCYHISQKGELRWSVSRVEPFEGMELESLPRNPFKIKSAGFGITLIKFEVFEKLEWPYWKTVYKPGGIEVGEDIYFFNKAREAGYDIWCHPLVKCNHYRPISLMAITDRIAKLRKEIKQ